MTVTLCNGPNRAIRALLATRGITISDVMLPLARRVDAILHDDVGRGYVRGTPIYLDPETTRYLEELTARTKSALGTLTYNPVVNIGAAIMWDRMGREITPDSIKVAMEFLNDGGAKYE